MHKIVQVKRTNIKRWKGRSGHPEWKMDREDKAQTT